LYFVFVVYAYYRQTAQLNNIVWQKENIVNSFQDGQEMTWTCLSGSLVTPWFVLVYVKNSTGKHSLLVCKDQCDEQTFRRLKVRLKFYQGDAAIPTDAS
jgi:hypothetical protein